ncbi:hypothetical protein Poli38472_012445 [Pythium oligandrum]|uniref:Uncharacterized protein n=1 Tax=Pythium oligandrum TaxID=41045 RepID=A0A8K1CPP7_PYTOL|nr:hypothetical protein Poli38472_012445 [Pythium oligandrum]|eukprot:TMW67329.1 hypothetical protein Poli38472_012445 [Pythium oligandrum]
MTETDDKTMTLLLVAFCQAVVFVLFPDKFSPSDPLSIITYLVSQAIFLRYAYKYHVVETPEQALLLQLFVLNPIYSYVHDHAM